MRSVIYCKQSSLRANRSTHKVVNATKKLCKAVNRLDFSDHVDWIYNPLEYAWAAHEEYIRRFLLKSCKIVFLGMNPGPWGMAQTGVPFGEVAAVSHWLGIQAPIGRPQQEHPKRPIQGFECTRSEVSGRRLWGLFRERFGTPEIFFKDHFVANYCPLVFMECSARNLTPDKLPTSLRQPLERVCDQYLAELIAAVQPQWLIGVGAWAEACSRRVIAEMGITDIQVGRLLHPSPASPAANRNWAEVATNQMQTLGIWD